MVTIYNWEPITTNLHVASAYVNPDSSFSNMPLVRAGRAAVRLVLRPKEDMPRPLLELRWLLEGGLNLAEENRMFPRLVAKEELNARDPDGVPREKGEAPYCPE